MRIEFTSIEAEGIPSSSYPVPFLLAAAVVGAAALWAPWAVRPAPTTCLGLRRTVAPS